MTNSDDSENEPELDMSDLKTHALKCCAGKLCQRPMQVPNVPKKMDPQMKKDVQTFTRWHRKQMTERCCTCRKMGHEECINADGSCKKCFQNSPPCSAGASCLVPLNVVSKGLFCCWCKLQCHQQCCSGMVKLPLVNNHIKGLLGVDTMGVCLLCQKFEMAQELEANMQLPTIEELENLPDDQIPHLDPNQGGVKTNAYQLSWIHYRNNNPQLKKGEETLKCHREEHKQLKWRS